MKSFFYQYRMQRFLRYLAALLLACAPLASWASCSGSAQSIPISQMPTSISVARDLPAGSMLTQWITLTGSSSYWSCSASNGSEGARAQIGPGFTTASGTTVSYNGVSVTVYNTNVPGIGIAVASRLYVGWAGYGWQGWVNPPTAWSGLSISAQSGTQTTGGQMAVALVKTSAYTQTGTVNAATVLQQVPIDNANMTGIAVSYTIPAITITPMTCTTPDVTIDMGVHNANEMPAVGSLSANPVTFYLDINGCPASLGSPTYNAGGSGSASSTLSGSDTTQAIHGVQYQISPSSAVSGFTNVAGLTSGGAGGVGIQLFDRNGVVVPFNSAITPSTADGTISSGFHIPITARYYRTGTVTGGPANTTMIVMMSYQ
jgi:major type 1 subunit fimbrin (pilin)